MVWCQLNASRRKQACICDIVLGIVSTRITVIDAIKFHFSCFSLIYLQYNCKDTSILSRYVMHPFWNYLVQVLLSFHSNKMPFEQIAFLCRIFISVLPQTNRAKFNHIHWFPAHRSEFSTYRLFRL